MGHAVKGNGSSPRERTVAFIVARLSSSRLPAKQLRAIGDRAILEWSLANLRQCVELDEIVLATVDEPANEPLRTFCSRHDLPCFWYEGEVDHVTHRLVKAAQGYNADICLLVSGDCPLVHAPTIDLLVRELRSAPTAARVEILPASEESRPLLEGVHVARRWAWEEADRISDRPEFREHQFPVLYRNPDRFPAHGVRIPADTCGPRQRLSVDTLADLEFMNRLHERLARLGLPFELPHALKLLQTDADLKSINAHVHQRGLVEKARQVLFSIDAGGAYGYGHFTRSRELALQIVERLGWPVRFQVDDERASALLLESGFRVQWGAAGRAPKGAPPPTTLAEAARDHDVVIVDVSCRRPLPSLRSQVPENTRVVVLDRTDDAAADADLVVFPGASGQPLETLGNGSVLAGLDAVILRREIRALATRDMPKKLDLLAYLHDETQRAATREFAENHGLIVHILDGFTTEFPRLLAEARVFLSGYGQAFYEAAAVGTYPVAWPISDVHRTEAAAFYDATGIPPVVIQGKGDLPALLGPATAPPASRFFRLPDGTPNIVTRLAALFSSEETHP